MGRRELILGKDSLPINAPKIPFIPRNYFFGGNQVECCCGIGIKIGPRICYNFNRFDKFGVQAFEEIFERATRQVQFLIIYINRCGPIFDGQCSIEHHHTWRFCHNIVGVRRG